MKNKFLLTAAFLSSMALSPVAHATCDENDKNCDTPTTTIVGNGNQVVNNNPNQTTVVTSDNRNNNNNNNSNRNNNNNSNTNNNNLANNNQLDVNNNTQVGVNNTDINKVTNDIDNASNASVGNIDASTTLNFEDRWQTSSAIATNGTVDGCTVLEARFTMQSPLFGFNFGNKARFLEACNQANIRKEEAAIAIDLLSSRDPQEGITGFVMLMGIYKTLDTASEAVVDAYSNWKTVTTTTGQTICVDENNNPISRLEAAVAVRKIQHAQEEAANQEKTSSKAHKRRKEFAGYRR